MAIHVLKCVLKTTHPLIPWSNLTNCRKVETGSTYWLVAVAFYVCYDVLEWVWTWFDVADEGGDKVQRFKKWFWSIIEKMSPSERQDLVGRVNSYYD